MTMEGLRGYLQLASGLAEMSRAKATEAASALLSLSAGLSGGGGQGRNVQSQVQDLAEELLAAAAANRRSLIALVRSEVERAVVSSGLPPDELDRARAAVAKLSADVEELRAQVLANPAVGEVASRLGLGGHGQSRPADPFAEATDSGDGVVVDAAFTEPVDEPVAAPPRRRPPRKQIADQAATRPAATKAAPAKKTAARKTAVTTKTTAGPATKATAKKATTKKATTKKATATKAATKKATAKRATTKKATAKRATTKRATTKRAAAKKAATPGTEGGA
jgi:hypothetical protein